MKKACELFQDLGPSSNEHCPYLLQAQLLGPQMREPDSAVLFLFQSFFCFNIFNRRRQFCFRSDWSLARVIQKSIQPRKRGGGIFVGEGKKREEAKIESK